MKWSLIKKIAAHCLRWPDHLFRAQVLGLCCTSIRGNSSVNLPGQLLGCADEVQVAFRIQSPLAALRPARRVLLRLTGLERPAAGSWAVKHWRLLEGAWHAEQWPQGKGNLVRIRIPGQAAAEYERLQLEILHGGRPLLLGRLCFEIIGEARAQQLRLDGLRAEGQKLWVHSRGHRHLGNSVPDSSDYLAPEFTLTASDLNDILPAWRTSLQFSLLAGLSQTVLETRPVTLRSGSRSIKGPIIPLKDAVLFPRPGPYCLVVSAAGKELAAFPFRIVSRSEWLQHIQVRPVLEAERVDGKVLRETGALHWGKHAAFWPALELVAETPAPNTRLKCVSRILMGARAIRSEVFLVRLTQHSVLLRLQRFDLLELDPHAESRRVRLSLTFHMDGELKADWTIIILPAECLTNFEGQLKPGAENLAVDGEAYEEIMGHLTAKKLAEQNPGG